jgi:predicted small secreted protein
MKKVWIFCAASAMLAACGNDDAGAGDRTYDLKTVQDSASTPIGGNNMDSTPTTNNNIYNPDSMPGKGTTYDTAADRKVPGQPPRQ